MKIKELRKRKQWNQTQLAEAVGVSRAAISLYEKEKSSPSYKVLVKLASALGPDFGDFLTHMPTGPGAESTAQALPNAQAQKLPPYPPGQTNVHAVGLLSDIPVITLRRVSFKARASFGYMQLQRFKDSDIFDTVLFRLPPGRTEEDYQDALVFDIEGDSMEPTLRDGQQVIAWPVPEGRWEYLHNTVCVVSYAEEVTVKAIFKNELNNTDGLTLHATGGPGGSFTVERNDIHSIWEVREFYGVVPVRLVA